MARPRKDDTQAAAPARIEAAFWKLLEETDYNEITVRRVSQESGTNRNSFYYHYENIEDLARTAFKNNIESGNAKTLIGALIGTFDNELSDAECGHPIERSKFSQLDSTALPQAQRVMLCARSKSPFLHHMVRDLLCDAWFDALHIDDKSLTLDERIQVTFIFAGLVAVLGSHEIAEAPLAMPVLAVSQMGRAAIDTLRTIAARQLGS